jgi:membrane protease YdiL (CAAX protease family)
LYGWPWLIALATGEAHVVDRLAAHRSEAPGAQVGFWLMALVLNSVVEEFTNRAFPMRVLQGRALWVRVVIPSLIFALVHLADEPFRMSAFVSRALTGMTLSLAYAATGNIWLAVGAHTGINYSIIWRAGSWHAGSLAMLAGTPVLAEELVEPSSAALAFAAYLLWSKSRDRQGRGRERYRAGVVPVTPRNCL